MNLVFMHGWAYTPAIWEPVIQALPDLPASAPALKPQTADIRQWAEEFSATLPENALLIGWSLGAMLALACAQAQPERIRGMFLIGATPKFMNSPDWNKGLSEETVNSFCADFASQPERTLQRFVGLQTLGDASRKQLRPRLERSLADTTAPSLPLGLAMLARADLRASLSNPRVPLKLLHGEHDALMPVSAASFIHEQLPHSSLEIIPAAGHAPLFAEPDLLAARIKEFAGEC